ncbi:MAG: hypothetical protein NTZ25_02850 [Candidatus Peregrinibacteria bacterium]|nr:hypothetical protein [Candidatus Peregrinibacteria bacterium]
MSKCKYNGESFTAIAFMLFLLMGIFFLGIALITPSQAPIHKGFGDAGVTCIFGAISILVLGLMIDIVESLFGKRRRAIMTRNN